MMMAKSCFNPQAAVTLWQRMQVAEENHPAPPELLSTHPGSGHRQERLQELLPRAQEIAAESGCGGVTTYRRSPVANLMRKWNESANERRRAVNDFKRKARDEFSFSDQ